MKKINNDITESDVQIRQLLQAAHSARRNAYCPYSEFRVGAAVLCGDGTIITGSLYSLFNLLIT